MPGIFYTPVNRKRFLNTTARLSAVAALTQFGHSTQAAEEASEEAHVALLSDTAYPRRCQQQLPRLSSPSRI